MKDNLQEKREISRKEIIDAIKKEKNFTLREILENSKPELNFFDENNMSPLFYAIKTHNIDIINLLLKYRADPYLSDKNGISSVDIAHKNLHYKDPLLKEVIVLLTSKPQKIPYDQALQKFEDINIGLKKGTVKDEYLTETLTLKHDFQQLLPEEQSDLIQYSKEHHFDIVLLGTLLSWMTEI